MYPSFAERRRVACIGHGTDARPLPRVPQFDLPVFAAGKQDRVATFQLLEHLDTPSVAQASLPFHSSSSSSRELLRTPLVLLLLNSSRPSLFLSCSPDLSVTEVLCRNEYNPEDCWGARAKLCPSKMRQDKTRHAPDGKAEFTVEANPKSLHHLNAIIVGVLDGMNAPGTWNIPESQSGIISSGAQNLWSLHCKRNTRQSLP